MITYRGEGEESSLTFGDIDITQLLRDEFKLGSEESFAVYWIECHPPAVERRDTAEFVSVRRKLFEMYGPSTMPSWLSSAIRADSLHYVGYSRKLSQRIKAHVRGDGSEFCRLFPPRALHEVWWYSSAREARIAERSTATELDAALANAYVHQA